MTWTVLGNLKCEVKNICTYSSVCTVGLQHGSLISLMKLNYTNQCICASHPVSNKSFVIWKFLTERMHQSMPTHGITNDK